MLINKGSTPANRTMGVYAIFTLSNMELRLVVKGHMTHNSDILVHLLINPLLDVDCTFILVYVFIF